LTLLSLPSAGLFRLDQNGERPHERSHHAKIDYGRTKHAHGCPAFDFDPVIEVCAGERNEPPADGSGHLLLAVGFADEKEDR
jgi:hypothetical protein